LYFAFKILITDFFNRASGIFPDSILETNFFTALGMFSEINKI